MGLMRPVFGVVPVTTKATNANPLQSGADRLFQDPSRSRYTHTSGRHRISVTFYRKRRVAPPKASAPTIVGLMLQTQAGEGDAESFPCRTLHSWFAKYCLPRCRS